MSYSIELRPVLDSVLAPGFGGALDVTSLWRTVTGLGWHRIGVSEGDGGVGGDLADLTELAAGLGRHAVPLPLLETALAAWTLARAGRSAEVLGDEPAVVVVAPGDGAPAGVLRGVRFLPTAAHVVLVLPGVGVVVRRRSELTVHEHQDLADDPVGDLVLDGIRITDDEVMTAPDGLAEELVGRAALLTAAALGGCVERAGRLVTDHVSVRHQFGRPLVAQQAVAHGVAAIACDRDVIATAVDAALADPGPIRCAAARATAARSATDAARVAHQLMGAMGITREHPLQLVTRRIWAWRDADRTQRAWEQAVGDHVLAGRGDEELWSLVTAMSGVAQS